MDQESTDTLNISNPINNTPSPIVGEPAQQEEIVRYPIISHQLPQEGGKRKLVLRTLQHIIFQGIRTIMNAVVTIFSMGLGVGLILGDTLNGSERSNDGSSGQSNVDSNDGMTMGDHSIDDAMVAGRADMVAAA
eukprot:824708_1